MMQLQISNTRHAVTNGTAIELCHLHDDAIADGYLRYCLETEESVFSSGSIKKYFLGCGTHPAYNMLLLGSGFPTRLKNARSSKFPICFDCAVLKSADGKPYPFTCL